MLLCNTLSMNSICIHYIRQTIHFIRHWKNHSSDNCILELPFLIGDLSVLNSVREKNLNKKSLDAVNYLENIYNILKELGFEQYVSFDLGVIGSMDYYTGIIFRGYAEGVGFSIVDGGRYDKLVKNLWIWNC